MIAAVAVTVAPPSTTFGLPFPSSAAPVSSNEKVTVGGGTSRTVSTASDGTASTYTTSSDAASGSPRARVSVSSPSTGWFASTPNVTVNTCSVSSAGNVTVAGTPEYSLSSRPSPGVTMIGTVTDSSSGRPAGTSFTTVTWTLSPSSASYATIPNENWMPLTGVASTLCAALGPKEFAPRRSNAYPIWF